ncbi:MAG: NAD(P) transhydrogenase subunit alpha [Eubacterium sp.]|nr:NAD(P) transhydrogenase subunit alpha [Eubacterium sp.]
MPHIVLIIVFLVATVVGYFIINNVPSLLHTPLMSGMNALSGITVLGALTVTAVALKDKSAVLSTILGIIAIIFAVINVAGGFGITARMLKMFKKKEGDDE